MKIVFLVASAQGAMCGIADYTARLAAAFTEIGMPVDVEFLDGWSFAHVAAIRRKYAHQPKTVFHMQYPSLHVGRSLAPALLPLLFANTYVTLHEFRLFNILRKLVFLPYSMLARRIVFSNVEEQGVFHRYFPISTKRLAVIPIGTNIVSQPRPEGQGAPERLIYFGQISRNKGIEFFIETIAGLRAQGVPIQAAMVGAMVETDAGFVEFVKTETQRHGIELILNLPNEAVSVELNRATLALLPFPDGVSNKRGSALACLDHGVSVLTTQSVLTPDWLRQVTHPVTTPADAVVLVRALLSGEILRNRAPAVLEREMRARDWTEIAREHLRIYEASAR